MSAIDAAHAVITWALRPEGPPPFAHPATLVHAPRLEELAAPPADLSAQASALAASRAARLHLLVPPFGDGTAPGPGGVLLAAVVAFAPVPPLALALADTCPPPSGAWDLVLRDAIVGPALSARIDPQVADTLRACSPLSALFDRPPPGGSDATYAFLDHLRRHPDGRRTIINAFAAPGVRIELRRFREAVMDRLRTADEAGRDLVLEIYESALVHHRERALGEVASAFASLSATNLDPSAIEGALAVATWWGPLWAIRRAAPDALRSRPYLEVDGYLQGTKLYDLARALSPEGAA